LSHACGLHRPKGLHVIALRLISQQKEFLDLGKVFTDISRLRGSSVVNPVSYHRSNTPLWPC
jgi:hypothetical protein